MNMQSRPENSVSLT